MHKNIGHKITAGWKRTSTCLIVLVCMLHPATKAEAESVRIQIDDVRSYFNTDPNLYECYDLGRPINSISLVYHDFDGDGRQEALVTASSCLTGTAGPDIHSVFAMNTDGSIRELKLNKNIDGVNISGIPLPLIGNRNWVMFVKSNLLCNQFYDGLLGGERESPLVECYDFENGEFNITSITYAPIFQTSFDCRLAKTDREIATCRDEQLAQMDRELGREYVTLLASLPEGEKAALIDDQKRWLKKIDSWAAYKWCCEELVGKYQKRIQAVRRH